MNLKHVVFWAYIATFMGVFGHATSEFFSVFSGLRGPEVSVWRYIVGAVSLLIVALSSKKTRNILQPVREHPLRVVSLAIFGMTFSQFIFHWSLDYAAIVQVATIVTMLPIFVVVVDSIINKTRITAPKVVSGIGASIGVVLLITDGYVTQLKLGTGSIIGVFMALMCATTASFYLVLVRPLISQYGSIRITTLTFVLGAIALWGTVGMAWDVWVNPFDLFERPPQAYGSILALGVWNTCIAFILWLWGLSAVPEMSRANYLFFLKPVIAAILASFILNNTITVLQLMAILMVCGCVLVEIFYDRISKRLFSFRPKPVQEETP